MNIEVKLGKLQLIETILNKIDAVDKAAVEFDHAPNPETGVDIITAITDAQYAYSHVEWTGEVFALYHKAIRIALLTACNDAFALMQRETAQAQSWAECMDEQTSKANNLLATMRDLP